MRAILLIAVLTVQGADAETAPMQGSAVTAVRELRARIDQDTAAASEELSPQAKASIQRSLSRFYLWVGGYCSAADSLEGLTDAADACVRNQYANYLTRIPQSVYRLGQWRIYDTAVYGLLWADDSLLEQDARRPFTWDLQVSWPHVDATPGPLSVKLTGTLSETVRSYVSGWAKAGWESVVSVQLWAINACYASATIGTYTYGGGAHGAEAVQPFNWHRIEDRPLRDSDLFRADSQWQDGVLALYRKRVTGSANATNAMRDPTMPSQAGLRDRIEGEYVVTDGGIRILGGEGVPRTQLIPDVDISWGELGPWLEHSAGCTTHPQPVVAD